MGRDAVVFLVRLPREEIAYFTFVLESYEGLGTPRTIDPQGALVELHVPPELEEEAVEFLEGMRGEIPLEYSRLDPP